MSDPAPNPDSSPTPAATPPKRTKEEFDRYVARIKERLAHPQPRHKPDLVHIPQMQAPIRYAVYTRQSVETTSSLPSCEVQFQTCRELALNCGEWYQRWIGERFDDAGFSGATLDRPALQRLRAVIAARGIERLYITHLDRLSRKVYDMARLLEELETTGVELRMIYALELGGMANLHFLRHLLASFAEYERELTVSRMATARAALKRRGRRVAGRVPFGYVVDHQTKQLQIQPHEAKCVREIFVMAAQGKKPTAITQDINRRGWRTKRTCAIRSGRRSGGGRWTPRQILALLANPVYRGRIVTPQGARRGCHPAIVDENIFQAARKHIIQRQTVKSSSRQLGNFPLRGKLECPQCKRLMGTYTVPHYRGKATILYRYYRCRSYAGGQPPCRARQYPAYEVEKLVRDLLTKLTVWQEMFRGQTGLDVQARNACMAWNALDESEQARLYPEIVQCIRFHQAESSVSVTLESRLIDRIRNAVRESASRRPVPSKSRLGLTRAKP